MTEKSKVCKRGYKRFLQTCEMKDIPYDTLQRTMKKYTRKTFESTKLVAEESKSCSTNNCTNNEEQYELDNTVNGSFSSSKLRDTHTHEESDNIVQLVRDDDTQWEILVDNELNSEDNYEPDNTRRKLSQTSNLKDLLDHEDFLKIISSPVSKSPAEMFLMLLEFSLLEKLPLNAISGMFHIFNSIFTEAILPETSYMIDQLLNPKTNVEFHGICPDCARYIGKIDNVKGSTIQCDICSLVIDVSKPSLENIFLIIDPSQDISAIINENDKFYDYVMKERIHDGTIRDIFDGKCYRSFVKSLPVHERTSYVTTILNTDGAPAFESSQYSIWPIYLLINELPVTVRLKNTIVCGMWFGKVKPPMSSFLEPLVDKMNQLSSIGIECKIKSEKRIIKPYVLVACVDSVARAPMQGHVQFNGHFGCSWCMHPGEWFAGSIRYPILHEYPEQRTHWQTISFMQQVSNNSLKQCYGVKSVSPLINLRGFDIISGYVPDYMHCYLAGVGKQITNYFLQLIPEKIAVIDSLLQNIQVPQQLARFPRSINDRCYWKAKEWENFILYYSVPIFKIVLQENVFKYWILLVDSLHILLREKITSEDLDNANRMLHQFNFETESMFGKKAMTFNVHQLLHICTSVMNWGPLWAHSTFPFESANHTLLQAIHCAKGVNLQILRFLNYQRCSSFLRNKIYPYASPTVIKFCEDVSRRKIQRSLKKNDVTYLGYSTIINPKILNDCHFPSNVTVYKRVVINGCIYTSENKNITRSNNSYCQLIDKTFQKILYFIIDNDNNEEFVICKEVNIETKINESTFLVNSIKKEVEAINIENIERICVFMKFEVNKYISTLPNLIHN